MADKLVTIATFADYIEADLAKQLLDDVGIKSIVIGKNTANTYSGIPGIASAKIQVFESQASEALSILESDKKGGIN